MYTYQIPTVGELLRQRYIEGQITIRQASVLFYQCGWDNYLNRIATLKRLNLTEQEVKDLTPLRSILIARVDWESYGNSLMEELRRVRANEILCNNDERNPYTARIIELTLLRSWLGHKEYQKVVDFEVEMYGSDAFSEHLILPKDYIRSVEDVKDFFFVIHFQCKMYGYHPDDGFEFMDIPEQGKTYVSEADARWLCEVVERCHIVCNVHNLDIYEIAYNELTNRHLMA